jgi:hypothetical protein
VLKYVETCSRADKALDGANKCLHTSHLSQPMLWSHMKRTMRIVPLVKYLMEALATPSPQFWKVTRSMKQDLCGTSLFFLPGLPEGLPYLSLCWAED